MSPHHSGPSSDFWKPSAIHPVRLPSLPGGVSLPPPGLRGSASHGDQSYYRRFGLSGCPATWEGGELKEKVPEAWIQKPSSASLCLLLAVCLGAGLF